MSPSLNAVHSVRASSEPDVFIVTCNLTDMSGETYDCDYCSRPDDPFGLNPTIRAWLADEQNEYEVLPYVAPTLDETRAGMPPITARQLRLTLVRSGYALSTIDAAISSMPEGQAKDEAAIEWEYATQFQRLSPTLLALAAALGISAGDIDVMWTAALSA